MSKENTRICSARVVLQNEDFGQCTLVTINVRTPYCYWHRLLKTALPGQQLAADIRLREAPEPHKDRIPPSEWPSGFRWCAGCQSFVPLWYATGSRCRACNRSAQQEKRLVSTYHIAPSFWEAIIACQGFRCAICRRRSKDRAPAVEHDHESGAVRGGCCKHCNHDLLGAAFDSPRVLAAALVYLLAPPTSGDWVPPEVGGDRILSAVKRELAAMAAEGLTVAPEAGIERQRAGRRGLTVEPSSETAPSRPESD